MCAQEDSIGNAMFDKVVLYSGRNRKKQRLRRRTREFFKRPRPLLNLCIVSSLIAAYLILGEVFILHKASDSQHFEGTVFVQNVSFETFPGHLQHIPKTTSINNSQAGFSDQAGEFAGPSHRFEPTIHGDAVSSATVQESSGDSSKLAFDKQLKSSPMQVSGVGDVPSNGSLHVRGILKKSVGVEAARDQKFSNRQNVLRQEETDEESAEVQQKAEHLRARQVPGIESETQQFPNSAVFTGASVGNITVTDPTNIDNVTKLSYMLYRLVQVHNVRRILDFWCEDSVAWLPQLLLYLDLELPGCRFFCVTRSQHGQSSTSKKLGDLCSPEYLVHDEYWNIKFPEVDLVSLWNVFGRVGPLEEWNLTQKIGLSNSKYVVIPNYPHVRKNGATGSRHGRVNVRRAPYRFKEPLRVINNISVAGAAPKQLFFYEAENLREYE